MRVTRKYVLLAVAVVVLIALWYLNRQGYFYEGFADTKVKMVGGNLFENFNDATKEMACKTLAEQYKLYADMLKSTPTTDEEKEMQKEITKALALLKAEQVKQTCNM